MDALSVCPRGEAAPCYDAWVESSLFEEKPLRFVAEPGVLEESGVARGVEGILSFEFWGEGFVLNVRLAWWSSWNGHRLL